MKTQSQKVHWNSEPLPTEGDLKCAESARKWTTGGRRETNGARQAPSGVREETAVLSVSSANSVQIAALDSTGAIDRKIKMSSEK
jgi:hypothetical protein